MCESGDGMNQNRILQNIQRAAASLGIVLTELFGVFGSLDKRWLDEGCDPAHHTIDLMHVLETQSVAGMHFMACGCVVFMTNEHVYLNQCQIQHERSMSSAEIAQKLVLFDPEHYGDIDTHPIPFNLDEHEDPQDTMRWEMFKDAVKDITFDFEAGNHG